MTKRTIYSKEFKVEAVRLLEIGDKDPADLVPRTCKDRPQNAALTGPSSYYQRRN